MADIARILAIDASGPNSDGSYNVQVLGQRVSRVTVGEDYDSTSQPTMDLRVKGPASAASFTKVPKGTPKVYTPVGRRFYDPGDIAGTIKAASGSGNVQIVESINI